jgi:hypothetical protein
MAERKGGQLTLILLDWEKELDKVDQQRMLQVLKRLGTPEHMLRMLENIYKQPNFAAQQLTGNPRKTHTTPESVKDAHCRRISSQY